MRFLLAFGGRPRFLGIIGSAACAGGAVGGAVNCPEAVVVMVVGAISAGGAGTDPLVVNLYLQQVFPF